TRPWPESAEYEFKDSSYSERGLAIYHGWLPLYAQAASFALAGVAPDRDARALRVRHSAAEMRRRNVAGRAPAALLGAMLPPGRVSWPPSSAPPAPGTAPTRPGRPWPPPRSASRPSNAPGRPAITRPPWRWAPAAP